MISRNDVYNALLAKAKTAAWGAGPQTSFVTVSRKWRAPADVPPDERPALFQLEPVEEIVQKTNMPYRQTFKPTWLVYTWSDPQDQTDIGAAILDDVIDALLRAIDPGAMDDFAADPRQTLDGLVYKVSVSEAILKVSGDDTGNGMAVIPLTVLVP